MSPQIDSQASHDVAIKVEPNEKRFKAGESGMGLFFLSDQRGDLVAMIKEVAERMIDLGLGQTEVFADFLNGFAALAKGGDLPDRHA